MEAITKQRVLEELAAIGFTRASDFYVWEDGTCRPVSPRAEAAVASLETTGKGVKVKCYDKLKALELLGKCLGLFSGAAGQPEKENNLLEAIVEATGKEVSLLDIPELQQAAAAGHELVEQTGAETL